MDEPSAEELAATPLAEDIVDFESAKDGVDEIEDIGATIDMSESDTIDGDAGSLEFNLKVDNDPDNDTDADTSNTLSVTGFNTTVTVGQVVSNGRRWDRARTRRR